MAGFFRTKSSGGMLGLLAMVMLIAALRAFALLYDHSLHSIDGVLQTWFALDNFAQGNQLGTEFQSYLGITMILALLPIFVALGQTLYASTVAATTAVVAGAFAAAYAVAWMIRPIRPRHRWLFAIGLVFVFYFALSFAAQVVGYRYPLSFDPGVSLRAVRGFLPFFVLPVFVLCLRQAMRGGALWPSFVLGLVAGAGLLWSNDSGIPLVLAMVGALGLALLQRPALLAKALVGLAAGAVVASIAVVLAVSHGDPWPWLQYNFRDVAGDQLWYFGPWGRETRIFGPLDLLNILKSGGPLSLACLLVLITSVLFAAFQRMQGRGSPVRVGAFIFVGASVIGTALIPQVGGHIDGSYNDIAVFLGACSPLILAQRHIVRLGKPPLRIVGSGSLSAAAAACALAMLGFEGAHAAQISNGPDSTVYSKKLGFYVTPQYASDLAAMEKLGAYWQAQEIPADRRLLSVYTSALDIAAGTKSPAPVGSLIHALGDANRAGFVRLVEDAEVAAVTTIAPDYSGWEGWIVRANWAFFRSLHRNYRPIARNDQHVLWVRSPDASRPVGSAQCRAEQVATHAVNLILSASQNGLASVSVDRSGQFGTGRTAILTVTETSPFTKGITEPAWGDFPRYGVDNRASIALVAPISGGEQTRLSLETLDGSAIGTVQCSASVRPHVDYESLPSLTKGIDQFLSENGA